MLDSNPMHAKPDLRVVLERTIAGFGSVIADVMPFFHNFCKLWQYCQCASEIEKGITKFDLRGRLLYILDSIHSAFSFTGTRAVH